MQTDITRQICGEALGVAVLAAALTVVIAWPVLLQPSTLMFGAEHVGRHHDPFTFMRQLVEPQPLGLYAQPLTDMPASWLAAFVGPVAAYNTIVLLTFPMAAVAASLLGRHLGLSGIAAAVTGLLFAFSPFHLAQSAYHPHIAQVQWIPLYVLAVLRCLERWSIGRATALLTATVVVVMSNLYGGFIAGVMTPALVAGYWGLKTRHDDGGTRAALRTMAALAVAAVCGGLYVWWTAPMAFADVSQLAARYRDLFAYSATWWAYLMPPIANPWVGDAARAAWERVGIGAGLLEQQVSLGIGVVVLAGIAVVGRLWQRGRAHAERRPDWAVPLLVGVAGVALLCSFSPERTIAGVTVPMPSAWLYAVAPMFRAYARFGVVVHLMTVILAGIAVDLLRRGGRTRQLLAAGLVMLAAAEYAVLPSEQSRDVLPTSTHRWLMDQDRRAIDCVPRTPATESIPWLTGGRIDTLGPVVEDCREPHLPVILAARGVRHLILHPGSEPARWFSARALPAGLVITRDSRDARLLEVTTPTPEVYTDLQIGFSPLESDGVRFWRWMEQSAAWIVVNTTTTPRRAVLQLDLQAFHLPRRLEIRLDAESVAFVDVAPARSTYRIVFPELPPGRHTVLFRAVEPPTNADSVLGNGDTRNLSFAVSAWDWLPEDRR
ncbi:MAG: hypothetical protein AMXMBFR57_21350 [Acidimicrobiia bacterium]